MSGDRDRPKDSAAEDRSFLARWSQRKQVVKQGGTPAEPVQPATAADRAQPASAADRKPTVEEQPIDLARLPKIEDLTAQSDFTLFLRKGVPDELKRLALRRLWTLDPAIRDFIEVAENQYDWNDPNGVPGFGPLGPDTDLESLLAQATGRSPAPAVATSEVETASRPAPPEIASAADDGGIADGTLDDSEKSSRLDAGPAESQTVETSPTGDAGPETSVDEAPEPSRPNRRRHGGALPA